MSQQNQNANCIKFCTARLRQGPVISTWYFHNKHWKTWQLNNYAVSNLYTDEVPVEITAIYAIKNKIIKMTHNYLDRCSSLIQFQFQKCLTSISDHQRHQVCLFLWKNFDEVLIISDTSACDELQQFVITITWLWNINEIFSLWPCDAPSSSELGDKGVVRVHPVQQVNAIDT